MIVYLVPGARVEGRGEIRDSEFRGEGIDLENIFVLCLSVCLFASNKRQNGWTDRTQIFCGPRVTPGKGYGWSNCQNLASIKILFLKILKIHDIFYKIFCLFLFYNVNKENMFTVEKEDGREAH